MTRTSLPDWLKELYPFESHFLETPHGRMHYLDEGKGETVLLLHGNPTWSFYYRNLIRLLRNHFRCIAPDHLGCGLSDTPTNYDYQLNNRITDIEHLIDSLGINHCNLVLHDWGGAIGMGFATRHTEKIKRITILNTAAFPSRNIPARISLCKTPILGRFLVCNLNGFAAPATWMASVKRLPKAVRRGYLYPYQTAARREAIYQFVRDIPMNEQHPSWEPLQAIDRSLSTLHNKPMLIGWGAKDFCFNDTFLNQWKQRFPHAEVNYYKDAGHYVLEDKEEVLNNRINDFLKR